MSAQYLKRVLDESGVHIADLAHEAGVDPDYLAKVLEGEEVTSVTTMQHWATLLGKRDATVGE